jgi:carbamoyltransferase
MIICGLKLTHDGAVALIEEGKLIFSIEMEKLKNNPRYTGIEDTAITAEILAKYGYEPSAVDYFVIDGWGGTDQDALALQPRLEIGETCNHLSALCDNDPYTLDIAPYLEKTLKHNVLEEWRCTGLKTGKTTKPRDYLSYLHAAGHIMGAYCTSPFAPRKESSYILVWDGGMFPRLYFFDPCRGQIENLGPIFLLIGNIYTIFSQHFGPFKVEGNFAKDNLSVAGKVMAYIALGQVKRELFPHFEQIYVTAYDKPMGFANMFANEFKKRIQGSGYPDEDILHTFHVYLQELLIEKLAKKVKRYERDTGNLCLSGGCGLNIKWNSAVRDCGLFTGVYTPPFPNDSGSALGAACCAMWEKNRVSTLDWTVYSGPLIENNPPAQGWKSRDCTIKQLASLLHESNEPIVFLNGKAELGPRALGNRSILAAAVSPRMKDILNRIKKRESYRPVSPLCLEERAREIFSPGTPDPYMLFDHRVRPGWQDRIPAVLHLDGTARLQTVNEKQNPVAAELLKEYEKLSGIPLLCNTSANFKGCGFFPDVSSAALWDKVNYIWWDNTLYERQEKLVFHSI